MRIGLPVKRDVVDPHVEVRPVDPNEKHHTAQRRIASSPRQDEADADGDFHHTGDQHPDGRVAQHGRNDRLKPGSVGEVLDTDIDVHRTEYNTCSLNQLILDGHRNSYRLEMTGWSPLP